MTRRIGSPSLLARTRMMRAPLRHGVSCAMVLGMAALPVLGLPLLPAGQPFLLVLAILAAALLFGRGCAVSAGLVAAAAGAALMLPATGAAGPDAVRGGLSLVAFLVVAFGMASAVESMCNVFSVMEVADARRASGQGMSVERGNRQPGALRLLAMTPEQRHRRFQR